MALLNLVASPLLGVVPAGVAGLLATIIVTVLLRLVLMPLSLMQIRSQRKQMAVQPELKALQKKFKGDREGLAREQMKLYKERGINPAAGCLPLLIQLPILFGMYAAMQQLSTTGWALEQVTANQLSQGQLVYAAQRQEQPLPYNTQFVLTTLSATAKTNNPITIQIDQNQSSVSFEGTPLLGTTAPLTLTPGQPFGNPNPPNTPNNTASLFLRAGIPNGDGTMTRNVPLQAGQQFDIEVWVNVSQTSVDAAQAVITWDPSQLDVTGDATPTPQDLPFKSPLLWLLGGDIYRLTGRDLQPRWAHVPGSPASTVAALGTTRSVFDSDGTGNG